MSDGARVLHLLPALPSAWPTGSVSGLRARGGFEVTITWAEGEFSGARITSDLGGRRVVQKGDRLVELDTVAGTSYEV